MRLRYGLWRGGRAGFTAGKRPHAQNELRLSHGFPKRCSGEAHNLRIRGGFDMHGVKLPHSSTDN